MPTFKSLQVPQAPRYWLTRARTPVCFLSSAPQAEPDRDGSVLVDILVNDGSIAAIEPAGQSDTGALPALDLQSRQVWPTLVDMHAHLDKGHIVGRIENPDGSFGGARQATSDDRTRRWICTVVLADGTGQPRSG